MSAVAQARRQQKELRIAERELIEQEKEAIRRSLIRCQRCAKPSRLSDWTFVQKKWWVPARGCTEGAYWTNSHTDVCDIVCPKCGVANYIYNHPQRSKLVDLLGNYAWNAKELFKEVTTAPQ